MVYTPQLFLQINDEVILQERKITNTTIKMTYPEISKFNILRNLKNIGRLNITI